MTALRLEVQTDPSETVTSVRTRKTAGVESSGICDMEDKWEILL